MNTNSRVLLTLVIVLFSIQNITAQSRYANYDLDLLVFVASGQSSSSSLQDVAIAQNELAIRYYNGIGGARQDYKTAFKWFLKSAELGNEYGMYNVANRYANGEGTSVNMTRAAYWLERAAMFYMHDAAANVAKLYYTGESGIVVDYEKAAKYAKIAVFTSTEDGDSRYLYAICHAYGYGVKQDSEKALYWANEAAKLGITQSYYLMGYMYEKGISVPKDYDVAIDYYYEGIDVGNVECMDALGNLLYGGNLLEYPRNISKALDYWEMAAENGHTIAMKKLAKESAFGDDAYKNEGRAIYWFEKLQQYGQATINDLRSLSLLYKKIEYYDKAAQVYQKMYSQGDNYAYNSLAYLYALGKLGDPDYTKALDLLDVIIMEEPDNQDFLDSKGEILLMSGNIKAARRIWNKINRERPSFYADYIKEYGETTVLDEYMKSNPK